MIEDDVIVSWESLFGDLSSINWTPSINLTQSIDNDNGGTFKIDVRVESKYIIGATYDVYSSLYQDFFGENGYLGITYVLYTNEFSNEGRLLSNANTCENRKSESFLNKDFIQDYWDYTLTPSYGSKLGNDSYLEYCDQNIWNLQLIGDECDMIEWTMPLHFMIYGINVMIVMDHHHIQLLKQMIKL